MFLISMIYLVLIYGDFGLLLAIDARVGTPPRPQVYILCAILLAFFAFLLLALSPLILERILFINRSVFKTSVFVCAIIFFCTLIQAAVYFIRYYSKEQIEIWRNIYKLEDYYLVTSVVFSEILPAFVFQIYPRIIGKFKEGRL